MAAPCVVCNENSSKYKCSTCFSPYCCVICWRRHKSGDSCKVSQRVQKLDAGVKQVNSNKYFTEDTVSEEKLSLLEQSQNLRDILSNKYLQSTLIAVDNASNPEDALKQAMKDPDFVQFVDECLKIVEDPND